MPLSTGGSENLPSLDVNVCVVSKLLRFNATISALATGRAALVTLPRICRAAGSVISGRAGVATMAVMAAAAAAIRNRRITTPLRGHHSLCKNAVIGTGLNSYVTNVIWCSRLSAHAMNTQKVRFRALIERRTHQNHEPVAG